MAEADLAMLVVLSELKDSDDEKPRRGKTRPWIKRRREKGYFNNIIKELRIEDRLGFRQMFRMGIADFEIIQSKISDLITPKERIGGTDPVYADERLACETFKCLHFQFRISENAVFYTQRSDYLTFV